MCLLHYFEHSNSKTIHDRHIKATPQHPAPTHTHRLHDMIRFVYDEGPNLKKRPLKKSFSYSKHPWIKCFHPAVFVSTLVCCITNVHA